MNIVTLDAGKYCRISKRLTMRRWWQWNVLGTQSSIFVTNPPSWWKSLWNCFGGFEVDNCTSPWFILFQRPNTSYFSNHIFVITGETKVGVGDGSRSIGWYSACSNYTWRSSHVVRRKRAWFVIVLQGIVNGINTDTVLSKINWCSIVPPNELEYEPNSYSHSFF